MRDDTIKRLEAVIDQLVQATIHAPENEITEDRFDVVSHKEAEVVRLLIDAAENGRDLVVDGHRPGRTGSRTHFNGG